MNKTLRLLVKNYGEEIIIARLLEQLRLLAECEDKEVMKAVKDLLSNSGCDAEYIYSLCEYTNLVTYVSEDIVITDSPWNDEAAREDLEKDRNK